jgi:hypothetical protein
MSCSKLESLISLSFRDVDYYDLFRTRKSRALDGPAADAAAAENDNDVARAQTLSTTTIGRSRATASAITIAKPVGAITDWACRRHY